MSVFDSRAEVAAYGVQLVRRLRFVRQVEVERRIRGERKGRKQVREAEVS